MVDVKSKFINSIRTIGSRTAESTLADYPTADDRCVSDLKSGDRMKQEANEHEEHSFTWDFAYGHIVKKADEGNKYASVEGNKE